MHLTIQNSICIVRCKTKQELNCLLDPISNAFEGPLLNREGHNFPSSAIPLHHSLTPYKSKCSYVIGVYNPRSLQHELLHAKYFLDASYRQTIQREWRSLPEKSRSHIEAFLTRLGYERKVHIDEYQAYRYTEAPNFFGIRL